MKKQALSDLSIRDGVVRQSDIGYILACDPEREKRGIPHTEFFKWNAGTLVRGSLNFDAHSCCIASVPETALTMLAGSGDYGITTRNEKLAGNIFSWQAKRAKYGMFRVVADIKGKVYAAGLRGMVYRLDGIVKWVKIDNGLPSSFDITAIDGFDASDIYAVGYGGALWHFNGREWLGFDLPTNVNLTSVKCASDGNVYVAGHDGILIRGRADIWHIVAEGQTVETLWDLEWFRDALYVSSMSFAYKLGIEGLELVDFNDDPPETCYHFSAAEDVMWSIGARDVMSFNGQKWTRII